MRPIHPIIELANAAFPNLEVELGDEQLNRSIISRRIGRYALVHLKMPAIAVELMGQRAVAVGLGNHLKLIWQPNGRMRYEGPSRKFDIAPGDLVVTAMAEDYRLEMCVSAWGPKAIGVGVPSFQLKEINGLRGSQRCRWGSFAISIYSFEEATHRLHRRNATPDDVGERRLTAEAWVRVRSLQPGIRKLFGVEGVERLEYPNQIGNAVQRIGIQNSGTQRRRT